MAVVSGGSAGSGIARSSNLVARIWRDFSGSRTSISIVIFPLACCCLAWSKAGHLQNTWWIDSGSSRLHSWQVSSSSVSMIHRYSLSCLQWPVRSWEKSTRTFLGQRLSTSSWGFLLFPYIFLASTWVIFQGRVRIFALTISCETGTLRWLILVPALASMSALSFPVISQWEGSHSRVICD